MDLLKDLNEAQRAAVEYIDGPSLVIAGAGSGKTRVLTYKIAYLLSQGMKPWSIMALTFTNKAAREMKERIGKLVGNDLAQHLYMGTFHSIFSRILRAEAEHIGFNNNFTIYDESDSRSLIKAIVKEMGLDDKKYKPAAVHAKISMAKNNLMSAAAYESDAAIFEQNKRAQMPEVGKIFVAYVQRCKQANAMDFDDLLTLTYQLFRNMRIFATNMPPASIMSWWMSIRIPTTFRCLSSCNSVRRSSVFVPWVMTRRVSIVSAVPISIIFSTISASFRARVSSNWSRTTALPRPSLRRLTV